MKRKSAAFQTFERRRPLCAPIRPMISCPAGCGYTGLSLGHHYRYSPFCEPPAFDGDVALGKRKRDPSYSALLFENRVAGAVGKAMMQMHVDHCMGIPELDLVRGLLISCMLMATEFIETEQQMGSDNGQPHPSLFKSTRDAFTRLPNAGTMVDQRRRVYQRAVPRTLSTSSGGDKKGAVFFSAHNLVTIMLQESQAVRKLVIASSEEWKTGALYKTRPAVLSDVVHGTRFLDWQQVCGKATAAEAKDLRVVLHGWTDEFTPIDGLSQKARVHKYGVMLCGLVNLPLRMRHYADHMLMLALYNSRYAKANGGLSRILTGVGADGTKYDDGCTFADELALDEDSPMIELPNDADPKGEALTFRLRLFFALASLDWLASGEFGPFAGSVSARRPCGKCEWFAGCACSFLPRSDPRRLTMQHHAHCRGCTPRTHAAVMQTVTELRELASQDRKKTAMKTLSTDTGIFSTHFASEHLLRDCVKDSTIDVMHVKFCGLTRYLLSWATDEWIPRDFSWQELNDQKNKYHFKRGVRVPDLERSKGDARGSCSIHLSGAETMAFAIAR